MPNPPLLHLGDPIRWNHDLYARLSSRFDVRRSGGMPRAEFAAALRRGQFGEFVAVYRPFWSTGGEMGDWDEELISLLPASCKIFACAGAGFDWVDVKRMAERGIIYCNTAPACTESAADAALWLLLSCFRHFPWSALAARSLSPAAFALASSSVGALARNPRGHVLGVVGFGRIGRALARKCRAALGMRVLYNDVARADPGAEAAVGGAEFVPALDDLLARADCVVLAAPYAAGERPLLDAGRIARMKRGARLVNVARGRMVDEEALAGALERGELSAAGLDVHAAEPLVNARLARMRNVEVTSHTAGASVESHEGFERLGMENILAFFETGTALTPVNLQWLKGGDGGVKRERAKL